MRNERGITLVALLLAIVLLIIITGISVAMMIGDQINKNSCNFNDVACEEVSLNTQNSNFEYNILKVIVNKNANNTIYDFKTSAWTTLDNNEYYIAVDSENNLFIVRPIDDYVYKVEAKLSNTNILYCYTQDNTLTIVQNDKVLYNIDLTTMESTQSTYEG